MSARRRIAALSLSALGLGVSATPAVAADLARCAAIAASEARLACYDQLAGRPADAVATPMGGAASSRSAAAPVPPATPTAQEFGLSQAQAHPAPRGPDAIEARVTQLATGAAGRAAVILDNGQTWTVVEEDSLVLATGDRVVIRRAALGSFLMTTPSKRAYRVRRSH